MDTELVIRAAVLEEKLLLIDLHPFGMLPTRSS